MLLRKEVSDGYSRDSQIPLKLHFPHYIAFVKILTYFIFIVINNNDFFFFLTNKTKTFLTNTQKRPDVMAHTYNLSTWEVGAGTLRTSSRLAWAATH